MSLLFHDFFAPMPLDVWRLPNSSAISTENLSPILKCDLIETESEYAVHADLPGVAESDVDISVENNHLVIKGHREKNYEVNDAKEHRVERSYGAVQRSIRLPANADQSGCNAHFENGVLTVRLPKLAPPAPGTKIPITLRK